MDVPEANLLGHAHLAYWKLAGTGLSCLASTAGNGKVEPALQRGLEVVSGGVQNGLLSGGFPGGFPAGSLNSQKSIFS